MPTVEERVDKLEQILQEYIINVGNAQIRTENEMRAFKDEMRAFKDEMRAFKDEMRQQNREMNLRWGEMAKKLGTITEDLVAPSIPRIVKEEFNLEVTDLIVRRKKKLNGGRIKEYDSIAVAGEYIFLNSTKSTLESSDIKDFIKDIQVFIEFFPEYKQKKIIGILASLYVEESVIKFAEKNGFVVLSVGDKLMEVKNSKGFKPKEW